MRVAFIDQIGDVAGGAQRSLEILLRSLPPDVEPHAILFGDGAYAASLRAREIPVTIVGLPDLVMSTARENPLRGAADVPRAIATVAQLLKQVRPDVVHTNTQKAHAIGQPASRLVGIPSVAHLRDIFGGTGRLVIRSILAACSRERIAISRAVADAFNLPLTHVIANPLDLSDYESLTSRAEARNVLGIPQDVTLISLVGRVNRWKGHDRFLRIAKSMQDRTNVHFAVVGAPVFRDAEYLEELRAYAASEGLSGRVHFIGWLDDVRVAYAASDLNVNCSDDEPFGRTIIEAAACGLPSVAFAGGGTGEALINGETGQLIEPGDEGAFAAAITAYIDDQELARSNSAAARRFAKKFAASIHAERVAAVLRRVAQGN